MSLEIYKALFFIQERYIRNFYFLYQAALAALAVALAAYSFRKSYISRDQFYVFLFSPPRFRSGF